MNFIDTHAHLYSKEFDENRDEVIDRAIAMGVSKVYLPNIDSGSIASMLALEEKYPTTCFAMMGLHPCSVRENYKKELSVVSEWLEKRSFAAVGEIGIDLYWDKTFRDEQQTAFREQIKLAQQYKLPYNIHCRNAFDEVYEVVSEFKKDGLKAIFHCFGGTVDQAERILDLGGFKLGIGGVVTFKNAGLDKVIDAIDLEHLVLETDAPYLAPMPYRGKCNKSEYVPLIAQKIADIKSVSIEQVADTTTQNANYIFD